MKSNRKKLVQYLENSGIETRAIMCGTLPDQPSLTNAPGINFGKLKNSRYIRDNGFFIGCHPLLTIKSLKKYIPAAMGKAIHRTSLYIFSNKSI